MFDAIRKQLMEEFQNSDTKTKFMKDAQMLMLHSEQGKGTVANAADGDKSSAGATAAASNTIAHRALSNLVEK
jgi:hypothetical protein